MFHKYFKRIIHEKITNSKKVVEHIFLTYTQKAERKKSWTRDFWDYLVKKLWKQKMGSAQIRQYLNGLMAMKRKEGVENIKYQNDPQYSIPGFNQTVKENKNKWHLLKMVS